MAERINIPLGSRFHGVIIANLVFTDVKLGRGADATVYAVEWNGTVCAAKRLHEILLEDESPGGADKFISNFEAECLTWSKLRRPRVVQFLGVYLERSSRLPVLVMEKMDTSLRTHLESHRKEEFPLHQKVFVLRQVIQAIACLHIQTPPLVHHDLSTNNMLLNVVSFVTKVKHSLRDWRIIGECQKVIQHRLGGGEYRAVAVNSEGLLAVTDGENLCVHLLNKDGALMRSIGKGMFGGWWFGVAFDVKGKVWVTDVGYHKVLKLSQDGQLLIHHASSNWDCFRYPMGVSVSTEGLIYICDRDNHRVTVHDEEGKFLFTFGSNGSGPGFFDGPRDMTFGSNGLVYVTDIENKRVCVWSKEGTFERDFMTKYDPWYIAATDDNHLVITSYTSSNVMVYTLGGGLVHEFGGTGSDPGRFDGPRGICVDDNGLAYVADWGNKCVQVF